MTELKQRTKQSQQVLDINNKRYQNDEEYADKKRAIAAIWRITRLKQTDEEKYHKTMAKMLKRKRFYYEFLGQYGFKYDPEPLGNSKI